MNINMEDRTAWKLIKQNKEAGFEYLFNKYYETLCGFAEIYLKSGDIASDLVSDFFIKLWNHRHQININNSVRGFIFRSVKNACLNYIRDHQKDLTDYEEFKESLICPELSPQEIMEFKELQKEIDMITHELPERRKLVLTLRIKAGLSNLEIAEALKISENTVKNQLSQAFKGLKEKLKIKL